MRRSAEERFWAKVDKSGECWLWTGAKCPAGYGAFSVTGRHVRAHRFSHELANGPIGDGLFVCHKCNNRACVRPEHLYAGSHEDNMRDLNASGRRFHGGERLSPPRRVKNSHRGDDYYEAKGLRKFTLRAKRDIIEQMKAEATRKGISIAELVGLVVRQALERRGAAKR